MATMLTLNNAVEGLSRIAIAHQQINNFYFGDAWEFASSGVTNYPAMVVTLERINYARRLTDLSFSIYIMDILALNGSESDETETLSDMISIAKDIEAEIKHPSWTWNVNDDVSFSAETFTEKFDDKLVGVKLNAIIQLVTPDDTCQIPMDSITRF